eukprot:m.480995 g.480995  ORF g.480995 m.480995 type:complete len:50 (-) comp22012_c0_seq1:207-356(-)
MQPSDLPNPHTFAGRGKETAARAAKGEEGGARKPDKPTGVLACAAMQWA